MNLNNQMYKMYNEMVKGYKENNDGLFEHGVRCWLDLKPENPFAPEEPAYEEFFLMQKGYNLWKMGAADRKINRRRMLEHAVNLCALNPKRPYRFDKKAEEEEKRKEEEARIAAERKAMEAELAEKKEQTVVLGVLPEEEPVAWPQDDEPVEKKSFLSRLFKH